MEERYFRGSFLQGWRLREGVYGGYFALCYMLHAVHIYNIQGIKEENKDIRPIQSYLVFVAMAGGIILVSISVCLLQVYSLKVELILCSTIC